MGRYLSMRPFLGLATGAAALFLTSSCSQSPESNTGMKPVQQQNEYSNEIRIKNLTDEIRTRPDNALALTKRAELYTQLSPPDLERARADIKAAVYYDSTKGEYYALAATIYRRLKFIDTALYYVNRAKNLNYESPALYISAGEMRFILKQYPEAIEEINSALKLSPYNAEAYFYKGLIYAERGDTNLATSSLQTAIEQMPEYTDAYNKLATLYINRHNYPMARQYLFTGLRFSPNDAFLNYNLGILNLSESHPDSAEAYFRKAVFFEPSLYLAHLNLGLQAYKKGQYLEAVNHFESTLQYNNNPSARFYLGLCRENLGNQEEALVNYREIIRLNNGYVKDAQRRIDRITASQRQQATEEEADTTLLNEDI